jgi:hypothetical protein
MIKYHYKNCILKNALPETRIRNLRATFSRTRPPLAGRHKTGWGLAHDITDALRGIPRSQIPVFFAGYCILYLYDKRQAKNEARSPLYIIIERERELYQYTKSYDTGTVL